MLQNRDLIFYQYLYETLGVRYLPSSSSSAQEDLQREVQFKNQIIWQHPHFIPQVIFFNQDSDTDLTQAQTSDLYQKIVQAMGLNLEQVWYVDSHQRSFMDFLNWLNHQNIIAPLVVMKKDPDIQNHVQNAGQFNWVECFSLQSMLDKTNLKKPTWEVLKLLLHRQK